MSMLLIINLYYFTKEQRNKFFHFSSFYVAIKTFLYFSVMLYKCIDGTLKGKTLTCCIDLKRNAKKIKL